MNNVQKPELFLAKLIEANQALYELFELCREEEPAAGADDGHDYGFGKTCFEVSGQYRRPGEFLAALLDMIRVTYEPNFIGSLFLNANPAFIYENVPKVPFLLGYLSVVGEAGESFSDLWTGKVAAALSTNGYNLRNASSTYIVVAGSERRMGVELLDEVFSETGAGFTIDDAFQLLSSELSETCNRPAKAAYAGVVWDEGLDTRLRVSLWMFIEKSRHLMAVCKDGSLVKAHENRPAGPARVKAP